MNIEEEMKKVYVAGAISAPTLEKGLKNLRAGIECGATLLKMGFCPFVPHLTAQFNLVQEELIPVETHYKYDLEWLAVCDCMIVLPGYENSYGVAKEIEFAKERGIPVFYGIEELVKWLSPTGIYETFNEEIRERHLLRLSNIGEKYANQRAINSQN